MISTPLRAPTDVPTMIARDAVRNKLIKWTNVYTPEYVSMCVVPVGVAVESTSTRAKRKKQDKNKYKINRCILHYMAPYLVQAHMGS